MKEQGKQVAGNVSFFWATWGLFFSSFLSVFFFFSKTSHSDADADAREHTSEVRMVRAWRNQTAESSGAHEERQCQDKSEEKGGGWRLDATGIRRIRKGSYLRRGIKPDFAWMCVCECCCLVKSNSWGLGTFSHFFTSLSVTFRDLRKCHVSVMVRALFLFLFFSEFSKNIFIQLKKCLTNVRRVYT